MTSVGTEVDLLVCTDLQRQIAMIVKLGSKPVNHPKQLQYRHYLVIDLLIDSLLALWSKKNPGQ